MAPKGHHVNLREANYKNGKREGLSKSYFENGQLKEETTDENDKREGISKSYYENGQLKSEINYINGKPEGLIKYFHENNIGTVINPPPIPNKPAAKPAGIAVITIIKIK